MNGGTETRNERKQMKNEEIKFKEGQRFRSAGYLVELIAGSDEKWLSLRDLKSNEVRSMAADDLRRAVAAGHIQIDAGHDANLKDLPALQRRVSNGHEAFINSIPAELRSEAAVVVMTEKIKWVKRLQRYGEPTLRPTDALLIALKDIEHRERESCPFTLHTLYAASRTMKKYGGDPRSLYPAFHNRGGKGQSRISPEVEKMITSALNDATRKTSEQLRPSRVSDAVAGMVKKWNQANPSESMVAPSLPTITRRFEERFSAYEVAKRNYGVERANRMFRENGARIRALEPLDVVEYDDTDTQVFMIDERTGLPWGRAFLTVGVDQCSGMVMGKSISEKPRSLVSAIYAIYDGIMPKNHAAAEFAQCRGKWDAYGHHGLIKLDNAPFNTSKHAEAGLLEIGSEVEWARPYQPTNKSDIEHFNAVMKQDYVCNLEGWSGPVENRDLLNRGIGSAVMTLGEFVAGLNAWIVDEYSNKPQVDGLTPRQKWLSTFADHAPLLPKKMLSPNLLGTIADTRKLRDSGGLKRKGLRYQSAELANLRKRIGANAEVEIRVNPYSLTSIFVKDPINGQYLEVPCDEKIAYLKHLTDYQQSLILKKCRLMKKTNSGYLDMYEARIELSEMATKLMRSKKLNERKVAYRNEKVDFRDPQLDSELEARKKGTVTTTIYETELERSMRILGEDAGPDPDNE